MRAKRLAAKVVAGLWLLLAGTGAITAPVGTLVYARFGAAWLPWVCGLVGLLLGALLALPMTWALRIAGTEGEELQTERLGPFRKVVDSRAAPLITGLLGGSCFALLAFGLACFVNGAPLATAPVPLDCRVTSNRMIPKGDGNLVEVEYDCTLPDGGTVSSDFRLPLGELELARVGRPFALLATRGRMGLWVIDGKDAPMIAANEPPPSD